MLIWLGFNIWLNGVTTTSTAAYKVDIVLLRISRGQNKQDAEQELPPVTLVCDGMFNMALVYAAKWAATR